MSTEPTTPESSTTSTVLEGVTEVRLDVPTPPGATGTEDDPCFNGVTTLRFFLPCDENTPTMAEWCGREDLNHNVIDGADLCATAVVPAKSVLPTTGAQEVRIGGIAMIALIAGVGFIKLARR